MTGWLGAASGPRRAMTWSSIVSIAGKRGPVAGLDSVAVRWESETRWRVVRYSSANLVRVAGGRRAAARKTGPRWLRAGRRLPASAASRTELMVASFASKVVESWR